jgi:hypothetical protein
MRKCAAVQVAPGHGYDLDMMDEAIFAARAALSELQQHLGKK